MVIVNWLQRKSFIWQLLIAIVFIVVFTSIVGVIEYGKERARQTEKLLLTARAMDHTVDQSLFNVLNFTQTLSATLESEFLNRNFSEAREKSWRALSATHIADHVVLTEESGQQLFNTLVKYGSPLPITKNIDRIKEVFKSAQPRISNLVTGTVSNNREILIDVPVIQNGKVIYVLTSVLNSNILGNILIDQHLPEEWTASIVDRNREFVARTRNAEKYVGKEVSEGFADQLAHSDEGTFETINVDGKTIVAAFYRSRDSGFSVGIGVPKILVVKQAVGSLPATGIAIVVAVFALLAAWHFSIRLKLKRESETKYRQLFETSNDGIFLLDSAGFFIDCNEKGANLLGRSRNEIVGISPADISPERQPDGRLSAEVARERISAALSGQPQQFEYQALRSNGDIFDAEIASNRVEYEEIPRVQVVVRDITERKQAELLLLQHQTAIQTTHDGYWLINEQGTLLDVNRAYTMISGYRRDELIGKHLSSVSGTERSVGEVASHIAIIRSKGWDVFETFHHRKDGSEIPLEVSATYIRESGQIVAFFRDITERKVMGDKLHATAIELEAANTKIEAEHSHLVERVEERTAQLRLANLAKDSFLATMSHEIRTPLGGLLGMMELLSLSRLNHEQAEILGAAQRSGNSLLRIVNDILDWSKIEAGKLELAPGVANIDDLVKSVANTYSQIASEKNIRIQVEIDPELNNAHLFDSLRVAQILNNFTSNALKFTQHGSIKLGAHRVARHDDSETVRFSVQDSGAGISKDHLARLFEQYEQASADTARMYGGTGLGLSICRRLADMMGGTLSVESEVGIGSTFSFTVSLPVVENVAPGAIDPSTHLGDEPDISPLVNQDQHIVVLIVDDHPLNRMLLKQQLDKLGVRAVAAADGVEALALWQTKYFDLIITDCHMPEMDGYELSTRIRDLEQLAGSKRIPIIAWTANAMVEEVEHCHAAGMDGLLTKPTELHVLRAKLLKWLVRSGVLP